MARQPRRPSQTKNSLGILRALSKETADTINNLTPVFADLAARPSDVLYGLIGFGGGISAAYLLHLGIPSADLGYGALAFGFLGAPLAMLLSRGLLYLRVEKILKINDLIISRSWKRLEGMQNGPPDLYEAAFRDHYMLTKHLDLNVIEISTGRSIDQLQANSNRLLPPAQALAPPANQLPQANGADTPI